MHAITGTGVLMLAGLSGQTDTEFEIPTWFGFDLFNRCRPTELVVENLSADEEDIGLTKEMVVDAAEGRLRSARLYTIDRDQSDDSRCTSMLRFTVSVSMSRSNTRRWLLT